MKKVIRTIALSFNQSEFEPYGEGNTIPKFVTRAKVLSVKLFGGNNSKVILEQEGITKEALRFFENLQGCENQEMELVYSLQWDCFSSDVILKIEDYFLA